MKRFTLNQVDCCLKDIPTSKIRSIAMGQVEVKGNVKAIGEPMIDPIDNKKCVYFSLSVEEKVLGILTTKKESKEETMKHIDNLTYKNV